MDLGNKKNLKASLLILGIMLKGTQSAGVHVH